MSGWQPWMRAGRRAMCLIGLALAFAPTPAQAGERTLLVLPAQFHPANHGVAYYRRMAGLADLCMARGAGYFTAVLELPAGTRLTNLRAYFEYSSDTAFGALALYRVGVATSDLVAITPMSLPKPHGSQVATSIEPAETVREPFRYLLHLTLTGPGVCFRAAEVTSED